MSSVDTENKPYNAGMNRREFITSVFATAVTLPFIPDMVGACAAPQVTKLRAATSEGDAPIEAPQVYPEYQNIDLPAGFDDLPRQHPYHNPRLYLSNGRVGVSGFIYDPRAGEGRVPTDFMAVASINPDSPDNIENVFGQTRTVATFPRESGQVFTETIHPYQMNETNSFATFYDPVTQQFMARFYFSDEEGEHVGRDVPLVSQALDTYPDQDDEDVLERRQAWNNRVQQVGALSRDTALILVSDVPILTENGVPVATTNALFVERMDRSIQRIDNVLDFSSMRGINAMQVRFLDGSVAYYRQNDDGSLRQMAAPTLSEDIIQSSYILESDQAAPLGFVQGRLLRAQEYDATNDTWIEHPTFNTDLLRHPDRYLSQKEIKKIGKDQDGNLVVTSLSWDFEGHYAYALHILTSDGDVTNVAISPIYSGRFIGSSPVFEPVQLSDGRFVMIGTRPDYIHHQSFYFPDIASIPPIEREKPPGEEAPVDQAFLPQIILQRVEEEVAAAE